MRVLQEEEDHRKHGIKLCRVIYNTFTSRKNLHKTTMDGEMQSRRHCPTHANMNRALNDDDDNDHDDDVIAVIIFGSNIFFLCVCS